MKYQIVIHSDPGKLEELVNNLITADWKPIGGVSVAQSESCPSESYHPDSGMDVTYAQAMIRE